MTASPLEARCSVCLDTGSLSQHMDGFLDCRHCDAVEKRLAMRAHIVQFTGWPDSDTVAWAAYLFAQRQAAPVAAQPEEEIDFLAMEFPRSTLKAEDWDPATKQPRKVTPVVAAQPVEVQEPIGTLARNRTGTDESLIFTPLYDFYVTDGMLVYAAPQPAAQPSDDVALKAKRYDWLREDAETHYVAIHAELGHMDALSGEELDAAIDAALAQEKA